MNSLNLDSVPELVEELVKGEIDEQVVAMNVETGTYHHLNSTGGHILTATDGQKSLREICAALTEEFDTDLETCQSEVLKFAEELVALGILRAKP